MDSFNPYLRSLKDYAIVGGVIVALIITSLSFSSSEIVDKKQMLRDQFALSNDIEMIYYKHRRQSRHGTSSYRRAVFRFTDAQLLAYKNKTHDLSQWRPRLLSHAGHDLDATYTVKARRWTAFPRPITAADMKGKRHASELPWLFHLWSSSNRETIKRGRIMCYLFEEADKNQRSVFGYKGTYRASACSELPQTTRVRAKVLAILDYDRKTLTVSVS